MPHEIMAKEMRALTENAALRKKPRLFTAASPIGRRTTRQAAQSSADEGSGDYALRVAEREMKRVLR